MRQYRRSERQHPIFSPVAILSTLVLIVLLSAGVYLTGGSMFSPGDLSAINVAGQTLSGVQTHAEVSDCQGCHTPFAGIDANGCESCHTNIREERQQETALHGRFAPAEQCNACHTEHKGADFKPAVTVQANFNHDATAFSLRKHGRNYQRQPMQCADCHLAPDFVAADNACADCHQAAEPDFMATHVQDFGSSCTGCHDGQGFMVDFTLADHEAVFPLVGKHADIHCSDCHGDGRFKGTPTDCAGCHTEPEVHAGLFSTNCADCHTEDGWQPAQFDGRPFDHSQTRFTLDKHAVDFDGATLTCQGCHGNDAGLSSGRSQFPQTNCTDCHQPAQPDWPLNGQHAQTDCEACHVDRVFAGTSRECVACHNEPAIHAGLFGLDCANCHTETGWQPAQLTRHTFPLNHGRNQESDCATCHTNSYTEYTCYNCHEHDPTRIEQEHREEGIRQPELA
ncbi:MAG: hypothetical protein ACE5EY_10570, partial [Anaerolineae bacterium]